MDRQVFTILLLFLIIVALLFYRVYTVVDLVTLNYDLADITKKISEVRKDNLLIMQEILKESSLIYIEEKARKEGFTDATYYTIRP